MASAVIKKTLSRYFRISEEHTCRYVDEQPTIGCSEQMQLLTEDTKGLNQSKSFTVILTCQAPKTLLLTTNRENKSILEELEVQSWNQWVSGREE